MRSFLAVDFGSTYTKLNLFDLDKPCLLAQSKGKTTIESSILLGFQEAFQCLQQYYPISLNEISEIKVCSSAAGGLEMVVIGLVPELTLDAAKKAALGAGARIVQSFSFFLKEEDIKHLENTNCDILLLTGGSNGGNEEVVLHNAMKLASSNISCFFLYSGNEKVQENIRKIFEKGKKTCFFSKNIMPDINQLSVEDCREKIREIFFKNIIQAKGLEELKKTFSCDIIPTPAAVLQFLENVQDCFPSSMLVDIGGATTDVHSVCENMLYEKKCFLEGLEEPFSKRTVEGDLGMRYSAPSVWENFSKSPDFLEETEWKQSCLFRKAHPHFVAKEKKEKQIDSYLAKLCVQTAITRHCGSLREGYTVSEKVLFQRGKDFRKLQYLIATGGILVHHENPREILQAALQQENEKRLLKPQQPVFLLDSHYLAASLGLLSEMHPEIAKELVKKYFHQC